MVKPNIYFLLCALVFIATWSLSQQAGGIKKESVKTGSTSISDSSITIIKGTASVYADKFEGRKTASGKIFSQQKMMVACHKKYPSGITIKLKSKVRVTNLRNNKSIVVTVYDRIGKSRHIVDLSKAAAKKLGIRTNSIAKVKVEVLE